MKRQGVHPAYVVIAAGVAAALHVGKLSPALPVLEQALGVTLLQAGFLLSLVQLAGMLLGLAVGLAADGLGLRRSMLVGLLLLSLASWLGGWAREAHMLLGLRAVEGLGFLLVSMPAPSLIRHLVEPRRMSAMLGLWGAYMPLGTATALLCGPLVISLWGWESWWWGLGAVTLVMAWWVWRVVPPDTRHVPSASGIGSPQGGWIARLRQTLSAPGPWLVAISFAVYSGQWLAVIGFLPTIYAQAGVAGGVSAVLTALVAAGNMVGNIVSGRLLGRGVRAQQLLYTGFAVMGLGTLMAFFVWPLAAGGEGLSATARFVAVLLFSMVGGVIPGTLFSLAVRLAPGEGTVSTTVGWMQQWASFGQFAGPPLVAWVASGAGGWHWTWAVTGACSGIGLLLAWRLGSYRGRA
ncbi:CynX/NimT family MFS transporter [Rhodoferax sp. BAB1]|uniref:MFS transporter n=1 Tax=Rhodoferax sp. BAB1 TaxID=2741720 RepID=UPI001575610A|nr:MFS transporter [Rhodoferax sp. BAB1]QKO22839.1 MFS transporter [Rhodoferax sp. BAB1]